MNPAVDALLDSWHSEVAVVSVTRDGAATTWRASADDYPLASVSKLITALGCLVAVEEGTLRLDQPAGPPGSTVRHLLAHTSGLAFDSADVLAAPGTRRIYSNAGFELLAQTLAESSGIDWRGYLREAVTEPLGMRSTIIEGSAAASFRATAADLALLATELLVPTLIGPPTWREAVTVQFPGLDGVLPGFGTQRPNPWGLGFEIRGTKHPHWSGSRNSPATFGHFGASGTFLWVDPDLGVALVGLGRRAFGPWAVELWPRLSDEIIAFHRG